MEKQTIFIVGCILILGLTLRIVLSGLAERELRWDSVWYAEAAKDVLSGKIVAECCTHGAGYPLFMAAVEGIFGRDNLEAVRLTQVALDTLTVILVAAAVYSAFGKGPALTALAIAALNPYSSSYTGVIMTEILSLTLVGLLAFLVSRPRFERRALLWWFSGITLGYLGLTKPGFILYGVFFVGGTVWIFSTWNRRIRYVMLILTGFLIVGLYAVIGNYQHFGKPTLEPPYILRGFALYMGLHRASSPELLNLFKPYADLSEEEKRLYQGAYEAEQLYHLLVLQNISLVPKYDAIHRNLFFQEVQQDPLRSIKHWISNAVQFWDKNHLFIFTDPLYPADRIPLRLGNIFLFLLAAIGSVRAVRIQRKHTKPFILFSLSLFLFMGGVFPLVSNLTRHSLPFYPVLFAWAGFGGYWLVRLFLRRFWYRF